MELFEEIKSKISNKTIENLAGFLGETASDVESGLLLSFKSFLAGLMKYGNIESNQKNIISVLNDGGHSGDIFKNIEGFSENHEKTQLLVTIGNNIVNHFLKDNTISLVEKISKISEIRKTSASSLLSLSAPLVLGCIGKHVRENNLDHKGLGKWFDQNADSIFQSLPPAIGNIFSYTKTQPTVEIKAKEEVVASTPVKKVEKPKSKINWGVLIPWLILGIAGAYALGYWYTKNKITNSATSVDIPVLKEKKQDLMPEDFLPDTTVSVLPPEVNIVSPKIDSTKVVAPSNRAPIKSEPIQTQKKSNSNIDNFQPQIKSNQEKKPEGKPNQVVIEEKEIIKIPSGFTSVEGSTFTKNSAEIAGKSNLNKIINELKNDPNKKVNIIYLKGLKSTLAEDRAYSLEGMLIENGVDPSQITVSKSGNGSNSSGVAYKIIK